jgi:hypothetical protein
MPKISTIDRAMAKVLHERLNKAIKASAEIAAVCAEFGLTLENGSASYESTKMTVKFSAVIAGAVSETVKQLAGAYGLDAEAAGTGRAAGWKITGYGRGRMPWQLTTPEGKAMKASTEWLLANGFRAAAEAPARAQAR